MTSTFGAEKNRQEASRVPSGFPHPKGIHEGQTLEVPPNKKCLEEDIAKKGQSAGQPCPKTPIKFPCSNFNVYWCTPLPSEITVSLTSNRVKGCHPRYLYSSQRSQKPVQVIKSWEFSLIQILFQRLHCMAYWQKDLPQNQRHMFSKHNGQLKIGYLPTQLDRLLFWGRFYFLHVVHLDSIPIIWPTNVLGAWGQISPHHYCQLMIYYVTPTSLKTFLPRSQSGCVKKGI